MLIAFQQHLKKEFPKLKNKRLLVAISGGLDSVVLSHLLFKSGYKIGFAHCNFNLRNAESDGDEKFVKQLAQQLQVPVFINSFQTEKYAQEHKISIQMAARALRYDFFERVSKENDFDVVVTAHHLDDQLETFLMNLNRGAGLNGLQGIPQRNGSVIRPLLPFSRREIKAFADQYELLWREDSSNSSNKYQRNILRNKVLPLLHEALPDLKSHFAQSLEYLKSSQGLVDDGVARFCESVMTTTERGLIILIDKLINTANYKSYLYEVLKGYGFQQMDEVMDLLKAQTGKRLTSETHVLLKNRETLLLEPKREQVPVEIEISNIPSRMEFYTSELMIESVIVEKPLEFVKSNSMKSVLYLDAQKVSLPLTLRNWKQGDRIQPLGMKGTKLVSDVLTDSKVSFIAKEKIVVLTQDEEILWIVGMRSSNVCKVTESTKTLLKLTYTL